MRLFVAIDIPEEVKEKIYSTAKDFSMPGVSLTKKETYHVTMQFLGERREDELSSIKSALSEITAEKFRTHLSGVSYFEPSRINVIFACVSEGKDEISGIYNKINSSLRRHGVFFEDEREYAPHVTISRIKHLNQGPKDKLLSLLERHSADDFGSVDVVSVLLKKSTQAPEGRIHETLYEAKL